MKRFFFLLVLIFPAVGFCQEEIYSREDGILTIGTRSSVGVFGKEANIGTGVGGHLRLKFIKRLNSEGFADYFTSDIEGLARRSDLHFGGSVIYYPFNSFVAQGKKIPFLTGGYSYNITKIRRVGMESTTIKSRNPAVRMGVGGHWYFTNKFDLSLSCQYMLPFGDVLETESMATEEGLRYIKITKQEKKLEGQLLFNISVTATIADLWGW